MTMQAIDRTPAETTRRRTRTSAARRATRDLQSLRARLRTLKIWLLLGCGAAALVLAIATFDSVPAVIANRLLIALAIIAMAVGSKTAGIRFENQERTIE